MKYFTCVADDQGPGCGQIDYVLFDGYLFGDRLLESVMFRAYPHMDTIRVTVDEDSKEFFENFNTKEWLKRALEFAKSNDIATCPKCGKDVDAQPGRDIAKYIAEVERNLNSE